MDAKQPLPNASVQAFTNAVEQLTRSVAMQDGADQTFTPSALAEGDTPQPPYEPGAVINGRYRVERVLGAGGMGRVYQVTDSLYPDRPTALKTLLCAANEKLLSLFRAEFAVMASLQHPNVAAVYDFERIIGSEEFLFTLELLQGVDLGKHQSGASAMRLVETMIPIGQALSYIHSRGLIHLDLKPSNVMVAEGGASVKVLDFGVAGMLKANGLGTRIMGTFAYMAPEVMEGGLPDGRSDLYSLGVMAFKLLTGRLPYPSDLRLSELFRCKTETAIRFSPEERTQVPGWLCDVVERLCAIPAAERYPSADALVTALVHGRGPTGAVKVAERADKIFDSTFVGRQSERSALLDWVRERTAGREGTRVLLVSGPSGVGKSRLVQRVRQDLQLEDVVFVHGDSYDHDIGEYTALLPVLLAAETMARGVGEEPLLRRYGPELVKIAADFARPLSILPSPPLHHAKAERQRILNAAADFLLELSQRIPYVLYLNDLQWAAAGTIDVLFTLASRMSAGAGHRLAILGSYRNDEVAGRPLSGLLERLTAAGQQQSILLTPISAEQTGALAESMLALPLPASLVAQLHQESGGLPFMIEETVRGLLESGDVLLRDDRVELTEPVSRLPLGVDVKSAILRRVNRLTRSSRRTLYALAVCGRPVEPAILAASLGDTVSAVHKDLQGLFEKHLLMPIAGATPKYNLAHDRIRETLYAALPPRLRGRLHRNLARAYLSRLPPQESGELLFVTVGHYSSAPEPKEPREREVAIDLNLRAARSAAQAAAFTAALRYLRTAHGLLPKDKWQTQRERALAVDQQLAESAYAAGDLDAAMQAARSVIEHAADLTQEAKGWEIWMLCAFARGDHDKALDAGIDIVNRLGPQLPKHPSMVDVLRALMRFKWDLHKLDLDAFITQPETTDARVIHLLRLYSLMGAEAYLARPKLLPILNFELGRQSMRGGHGPPGAAALMSPAVCFSVIGDYATAARLAEAGLKLLLRTHKDFQGKALLQFNMFVRPWREPLRHAAAGLLEGQQASLEAGDLEYAGFARSAYNVYALYSSQPLSQILAELAADARTVENSGSLVRTWSQMFKQMVHGLQHGVRDPFVFQGPHFQQTAALPPPALSILSGWQYLLAGFYRIAATHQTSESEYLSSYLDGWAGSANPAPVFAYACLSWLQACRQSTSWWQRQRRWLAVSKALAKLRQWARAAPFNHAHRPTLIEAERLRTQQKLAQAIPLYEQSIAQAEAGGFRHDVALAQELLAEVHIERGQEAAAGPKLRQAHRLYAEWGAAGKVADLQARYSRFL